MKFQEVSHFYLGCKVVIDGKISTMDEVNGEHITSYESVRAYPKFREFTPALHDVKSLSRDEILELIYSHPVHGKGEVEYLGKYGSSICYRVTFQGPERKYQKMFRTSCYGETPEQFKFLISKKVDVFGLIASREAVKLTKKMMQHES